MQISPLENVYNKVLFFSFFLILLVMQNAYSAGISVDAGLTPSEKRWIFREQIRFNSRSEDPSMMNREMTQNSLMTVLAYGLKRDITLVVKQMYMDMDMQMGGNTTKTSGFMDTGLLIKYGVFRENTASRILGAAATLEIELPTGKKGISSETWDLKPGLYFSMRKGNWLGDFSFVYTFNGVGDSSKTKTIPGDQFSINTAFAYQTTLGEGADKALAYVLELSHEKVYTSHLNSKAVRNTGEDMTLISPGLKLTISSFVTELLLQIPTSQNQKGNQLKRDVGGLFGIRYMF